MLSPFLPRCIDQRTQHIYERHLRLAFIEDSINPVSQMRLILELCSKQTHHFVYISE